METKANGHQRQEREDVTRQKRCEKRGTEYCSSLYTESGNSQSVVTELNRITPPPNEDELHHILYEDFKTVVKRLKKHQSSGIDDITGELVQAGGEKVVEELHYIYNQIWKEGSLPEEWAKSVIITIPKKGDLSQRSNYRTILRS